MSTPFPELHPAGDPRADDVPVVLLHGGNVANWMWEPQLAALSHRTVATPDLPGFGSRTAEPWPGLSGAADDVVARVSELSGHRRFHVIGLSLGGVVALHLAARHPEAAASVLATGAPLVPIRGIPRLAARLQLALWDAPWFWKAQAVAFRLPADSRERYVSHGLSVRHETAQRVHDEVHSGVIPADLDTYPGRMLLVAGERDSTFILDSLRAARSVLPQVRTATARGMHHVWNVENPDLFDAMIRAWLAGHVEPRLRSDG